MTNFSNYELLPGKTHPIGATIEEEGVNFCIYCDERATAVELLLFGQQNSIEPDQIIRLDPLIHRSFYFWHVFVKGLPQGTHYGYRVDGPYQPENGLIFDKDKVLIDPYSKGINRRLWNRVDASKPGCNLHTSMRSCVVKLTDYDWQDDKPLNQLLNESIIYELNVGGFSKSPTSQVKHPGTYAGVIEKIPYLKKLGITAVELLPVFEFDDSEVRYVNGNELVNYWGYSTISFFSPHSGYCINSDAGSHLDEFRDLVKALHKADIGVILDVVFTHTDEGNEQGPVYSFKGLANDSYYFLVGENKKFYFDYSGCGNTFKCNHPISEKFILDCLEYWVREVHVDGFRFDEGTILARSEDGGLIAHPPVVWGIELSEQLADTKVIAEAWDAGGGYMVGSFPGHRWAEWNGVYRDDIRDFVRGRAGMLGIFADRITGSANIYQQQDELPSNSVNFINVHDGFTLNDLVSYNDKHNEANGENNRDGVDDNRSWNCGVEGGSTNEQINRLRKKQIKNFATILMLSKGVPMFVAGDEVCRTQYGNNNAYCQDNAISWFNWDDLDTNQPMLRFWQRLIAFRKRHPRFFRDRFYDGEINQRGLADISWHGCELGKPGWQDKTGLALAMTIGAQEGEDIHIMFNMYWFALDFELPYIDGENWYCAIDTSLASPFDIAEMGDESLHKGSRCKVSARSIIVLISK
ncbi:glycogen debranching protein GlgX [Psychromonas antarctica]|uniref:glycogen debranching protein GlgX n=1 Tax=Psychromonas antarctica TaxID=67573 RepID=UPI001EE9374B|nr:glycogen debranching protein GlgX [Psychromonas antarctica]MCG6202094.1 glycogen debranching protein GlgX [Psychromonas antarctica]